MLYELTFHWNGRRYERDFPTHNARPQTKFERIRRGLLRRGVAFPPVVAWTCEMLMEDTDEYSMLAECTSILPRSELERLFLQEFGDKFSDRVEVQSPPRKYLAKESLN